VLLGRIQPDLFPQIFGPNEDMPLDLESTRAAFESLTALINLDAHLHGKSYSSDEVAYGFIRVANEAMARPIRNLTTMRGYDVTKHTLACFGGAGPQHCCAIAKTLGMKRVLVNKHSGILSAYGLSLADIVVERQEPFNSGVIDEVLPLCEDRLQHLESLARDELRKQGFADASIEVTRFLNCRYQGTDTALMTTTTTIDSSCVSSSYVSNFVHSYRTEFGFELVNRYILVDDVRVRAIGKAGTLLEQKQRVVSYAASSASSDITTTASSPSPTPLAPPAPSHIVQTYFDGRQHDSPVYFMSHLAPSQTVAGPAIIVQDVATVVVEPGCEASITASGDIAIVIQRSEELSISTKVDPIFLSIFSHRFMGIAEQMGRTLQRTSVSVNIKERLDFSCALFDALGGLVANAPHLPVHLGAMSEAVRYQIKYWGADLEEGDVLVSNHPQLAGGSHLPDITVITPIYKYVTCMLASMMTSMMMMMMMMMMRYIQLLSLDPVHMHACISPSSGTIVLPSSSLREVTMLMWGE